MSALFKPVDRNRIELALSESFGEIRNTSPEALKLAAVLTREHIRSAVVMLEALGFVVAERDFTNPAGAVGEVISIFASGKHHAPGRMTALEDAWPALHEALNNLLAEIDH